MSNISINYILLQDNDKNILQKMVNACKSEKHNVSLVLNDFSLDKQIENTVKEINPGNISLSVVKHDYEDSKNAMDIITKNFAPYAGSGVVSIVYENLLFLPKIFDEIDFDILSEESNAFIYGDYHIDDIRFFLRSHGSGIQLNIPFVFWSVSKLVQNLSQEKPLDYVFNNYAGIHIPQSMCTIYTNEEE